ncbi:MAG: hypothetical protein JWL96_216 [Sphingomonas bacterium]|uniref:DUF5624 domain-containing protein n=1 Tax=Sphingomonas bacterium TaxID=1895847 RepID=UPI00261A9D69|nr:DUF5624 domain-containing protein [Sphingomonas bacterium]MDB5708146.1 hypothetical protein [Sphingomonas bacterium]
MTYQPDSEFQELYNVFTGAPDSIGAHLNGHSGTLSSGDPLLVVTGSDFVIFPGNGQPPLRESFRTSMRGFVELTAISHLGVAVPFLIRLKELGFPEWEADAHRFIAQTERVRAFNSLSYWRDTVAVEAWRGREEKITDLVDYSCDVTLDFLRAGLADPARFTFPYLRENFLDPVGSASVPVPMNDMMAATFALVFLDSGFRVIRWLRALDIDWTRLMVIFSGRAGRPTAALTWQSNSQCHVLHKASGERLPPERVYIAPHAPAFVPATLDTPEAAAAVEAEFRKIWFSIRTTVEMGRAMYADYPAYQPMIDAAPVVDPTTQVLGELPRVKSPEDRRAFITLLRYVMEDPRQQLANASAHYITDQLTEHDNQPDKVIIPGFTNTTYPRLTPRR